MVELILSLLDTGLKLWLSKEKTKYVDKLMALRKAYYDEFNKPIGVRSNAVLDNIEFELRNLAAAFTAEAGVSSPGDQQPSAGV